MVFFKITESTFTLYFVLCVNSSKEILLSSPLVIVIVLPTLFPSVSYNDTLADLISLFSPNSNEYDNEFCVTISRTKFSVKLSVLNVF